MAKQIEFKQFDVLSVAKILGILGAIAGFIVGVLVGLASSTIPMGFIGKLGWMAVIALPILYGIIYFLIGLIGAALYNLIAARMGGIKVKI